MCILCPLQVVGNIHVRLRSDRLGRKCKGHDFSSCQNCKLLWTIVIYHAILLGNLLANTDKCTYCQYKTAMLFEMWLLEGLPRTR